jgi:DNA-binding response OmpR family regulator
VATILLVEDDDAVAKGLIYALREEGYGPLRAKDGPSGWQTAISEGPDLILLDVRLPGMTGFDVLRKLRDAGHAEPIIMLTARDEETDRVLGLELGADDYVVKPFSLRELLSRIRAQLRRAYGSLAVQAETVTVDELEIDRSRHRVRRGGESVDLTPIEFRLLAHMVTNADIPISRRQLIDAVWGPNTYLEDERTVDVHIRHLREKIEEDPGHPRFVTTVRGVGYRFVKKA